MKQKGTMNDLEQQLHYPMGDALPELGQCITVAPGVKWIRMALPFALNHINLWLLRDEIHGQQGWSGSQVRFFHERTGCDLRGIHRTLPCNDCHVGGNFTALSTQCVACHRAAAIRAAKEDPKAGGMAHAGYTQCAVCHNANFFDPAPHPGGSESVCQ